MSKLKELLGEDLYTQVKQAIGDKELIINDGSYIPRTRLNEELEKAKALQEKYKSVESQLAELSKSKDNAEELQAKLSEMETKLKETEKTYKASIEKIKTDNLVYKELTKHNVHNPDLVKKLINYETIKVDNDNVVGLKEQLENIKKTDPYLFKTADKVPTTGGVPTTNVTVNPFKKGEGFSLVEQAKLFKSNPDLAMKLKQEALES